MIIVDAQEVASDLGAFLRKVERGETVVIAVHDRPVAELRPTDLTATSPRPAGLAAGEFVVPDDFDAPLPAEIIADFEAR
jgi:antitoxin (DNA-binding transcriptional repressor) of toxin-antitoxin stability system